MHDLCATSARVGRLLESLKDRGKTVVLSGGAGNIKAATSAFVTAELVLPHHQHIDAVFASSGSALALAPLSLGRGLDDLRQIFLTTELEEYIDDAAIRPLHMLRRALKGRLPSNNGDKLQRLLQTYCLEDQFSACSPDLFILATPNSIDHGGYATIFGVGHTPPASVSEAVAASVAHPLFFANQRVGAHMFSDAAHLEPLPTLSILSHFHEQGVAPREIFIIAVMITFDFVPLSPGASPARRIARRELDEARILIINQLKRVTNAGAQVLVIHPNMDRLNVELPKSTYSMRSLYREIDIQLIFSNFYPALKQEIARLMNAALDHYDAHPRQPLIVATHDSNSNPKILEMRCPF